MKKAQSAAVISLELFQSDQIMSKHSPKRIAKVPKPRHKTPSKPDRFLRIRRVLDRVGIARSTLYTYMEAGRFPTQIKIGRASYWSEQEIIAWMEEHKTNSRYTG